MKLRSTVVTAAVSAAAALAATGITYASAAPASAPHEAPAAVAAAKGGGNGNGNGNNNNGGGKGNEGNNSKGNEGKGNEGRGGNERDEDNEGRHEEEGRIQVNERTYFAHPGDCITVLSGLGAKTLNIRNESRKTVEVFRGAVCDNGAPIATVGRHSSAYGVRPGHIEDVEVKDGVLASFRVVKRHHDDEY
ncbi:hypothetical protein ACWDU8_03470 [Streptomyces sp. NPDC003388]|uniref:hypothetical protein n=1 Tax=Streptomyces sp. ATE26 TaxID=2954237 RepID=UPI002482DF37|nr:hypothetical protein [Streptomyces sp. ATE26]MDI1457893.1 hypothetical protein [Streptomyces sp. ATE26]